MEHKRGRLLGSLALLALLHGTLLAQEETAPHKPRVGDWVTLRLTAKTRPTVLLKETLVAADDTLGTIKFEQRIGDTRLPAKEAIVALEQLRDPIKLASRLIHSKIDKLMTGTEKLEVKGKQLACEWTTFKVSFEAGGKTIESTSKIWVSPVIPLSGLVKMENDIAGDKTTMELTDYGRR